MSFIDGQLLYAADLNSMLDATAALQVNLGQLVSVRNFGAAGDGVTDDAAAVQAAVNSFGAFGGEVIFPYGIFKLESPVLVPSNVTLRGAGGKVIKGANVSQVIFLLSSVANVRFVHMRFDNTGGNLLGPTIRVTDSANVSVLGGHFVGGYGIDCVQGVTRLRVKGNDFDGARSAMGVGTTGTLGTAPVSTDLIFSGNTCRNLSDEGVDINDGVKRAVIANNTFVNCSNGGGGGGEVIDVGGGVHEDITITGNIIDLAGMAANGITVKIGGTGSTTKRVSITGNTISNGAGTTEAAIYLTAAQHISVSGNNIGGTFYGVVLQSGASDVTITGNNIEVPGRALSLNNGARVVASGNRLVSSSTTDFVVDIAAVSSEWAILNNRIRGGGRGICPATGTNPGSIHGNDVSGAQTYGIFVLTPATAINDNRVHDNGSLGICVAAANCTVSDNVVTNNSTIAAAQYGIQFNPGADGAVCTGNQVTGTAQGGIRFAGAMDRVLFANNRAYANGAGTNISGTASLTNSVNINNLTA